MSKIVLPKKFHSKYPHKFSEGKKRFLCGKRILPTPITGKETIADLVDSKLLAYNGARLQEACRLFNEKMLATDVTVGMTLAGALTPAGLGASAVIPLIKAGFVDWIVATGANLYHDMHHAMNLPLYRGSPFVRDPELRKCGVVRIYDILLDYNDVLMLTDDILRKILLQPEFQKEMGTAELHYLIGKYCAEFEEQAGLTDASMLAAAYRAGVPCFCPSPGDSTIGMNVAGLELRGSKLRVNPSIDVNETTSIVLGAQLDGRRTGVLLCRRRVARKTSCFRPSPRFRKSSESRNSAMNSSCSLRMPGPTRAASPALRRTKLSVGARLIRPNCRTPPTAQKCGASQWVSTNGYPIDSRTTCAVLKERKS